MPRPGDGRVPGILPCWTHRAAYFVWFHLVCDVAILGACLVLAFMVGHLIPRRSTERLSIGFWMLFVTALCVGGLHLAGLGLNRSLLGDLYGLTKVGATVLLWIDVFLFLRWPRRQLRLAHFPDPDAELENLAAERVRTEEELRQSESRFRTIFDNTRDVITYVDTHGRMLAVNSRVEEIFGYKPEELIGKRFTKLGILRLRDIPRMAWLFRRTILQGKPTEIVELELKHRNGDSVWVEVGTRFVRRNGRVTEVVNVFRDVTERKRKEVQLAHLSAIVDSFPDAIVGNNLDGVITSWNAGAERLYGYLAEEAVGQPFSLILPTCRPDEAHALLARLRHNKSTEQCGAIHRRKDGTLVDVSMTLSPVKDLGGRIIGASMIAQYVRDLTGAGKGLSPPLAVTTPVQSTTSAEFV